VITRVEFTIDDNHWPKLSITGQRVTTRGERAAFDQKMQYDLAYSQFENLLHNQLRPAIQELIERRKATT